MSMLISDIIPNFSHLYLEFSVIFWEWVPNDKIAIPFNILYIDRKFQNQIPENDK